MTIQYLEKRIEELEKQVKALEQEPCDDVVRRQAVLEMAYDMSEIDGEHFTEPCMVVDVEDIQKLPSVRPQEQTGHWEWLTEDKYRCSNCNRETRVDECMNKPMYDFCPFCNARMVEPQESEDKG